MRLPPPRATVWIAAVTAGAYVLVNFAGLTQTASLLGGFVPARLGPVQWLPNAVPVLLTPLTATLLHVGILHLAFNLMMLAFCGRFVEAAIGVRGQLILYVVGAYAAALAQWAAGPQATAPMIGASGAVSAIVGAYALLYGQQRTRARGPFSATFLHVLWLAAAWIGLQLLVGFATLSDATGGIAVAAHIGGFLAGLALARPLLLWRYRGA